jgi:hypothetical protein
LRIILKTRKWEKDFATVYDECDSKTLIDECEKSLNNYLALRTHHSRGKTYEAYKCPLDHLNRCIELCATAIKFDNKNHEIHFKLATLLEEKHYLKEIFDLKNVNSVESMCAPSVTILFFYKGHRRRYITIEQCFEQHEIE